MSQKLPLRQRIARFIAGTTKRAFAQGAVIDRISSDWRTNSVSGNQEMRADIRELRRRARALFRDDPTVNGLVREWVQNIVGEQGIIPLPKNESKNGTIADSANAAIKDAWDDWSHAENASTDGVQSWVEIQDQAVESFVVDGEVLLRKHRGFNNDYAFAVELIDPDLLDERMNRDIDQDGNRIVMGVELNRWHKPIFYHLFTKHPSEPGRRDRVRVAASEIIHIFKRKRVGQSRGVSYLTPILFRLHMLSTYEDAEVTAARISASKMGFFETDNNHLDAFEAPKPGEKVTIDVSPGSMEQLPPGMKFKEWNPQHPNSAYKEFISAANRAIAVGAGVAYTTLTGDLSGVNYSSIRTGLLSERDNWRRMQGFFAEKMHRLVFSDWLDVAILTDKLSLPSRISSRWKTVTWKGRGWKWIDPYNDARANEMLVAMGMASRTQLCAEMGVDFEETLKELAKEKELSKKYDVFIDGMAAKLDIPQPIPDPEQSGGSGTPNNAGGDTLPAKPRALPATGSHGLALYYDKTTRTA